MDKSPKQVHAIAPFGLKMQPALKAAMEEAAKNNARSLNAEIVNRLEKSLVDARLQEHILEVLQRVEAMLDKTR